MATHSCVLAWRIPWAEEAGGLQSMATTLKKKKGGERKAKFPISGSHDQRVI